MFFIAGFIVVRIGMTFSQSFQTAANITHTITTPAPTQDPMTVDSDGDGLSDRDEMIFGSDAFNKDTDGDGFIDGEETASGTDPLDPNSNIKNGGQTVSLISHTANLTDRILNLGIASLVNDGGELDPQQMNNQKFADIVQSINADATVALTAVPVTDADMKITEDNSQETIKKYMATASQILEEGLFSSAGRTVTGDITGMLGIPKDQLNFYEAKYNQLKMLTVPSSWKEIHRQTLINLNNLNLATKALTDTSIEEDPVKASFAVTQIQQSFLALHDLLNQSSGLAKSQSIYVQDSILQMVTSSQTPNPSANK
jgi:hypothetical protein